MDITESIIIDGKPLKLPPSEEVWCPKMCIDGVIADTITSALTIDCSALASGTAFNLEFCLRGNTPFLWADNWGVAVQCLDTLKLDTAHFPEADVMRRYIEVLCARNRYPGHSLMRMSVWADGGGETHFAIRQKRLPRNPYEPNKEKPILGYAEGIVLPVSPLNALPIPRPEEYMAHKQAIANGFDGALMERPDGRITFSTIGNIYLYREGNMVCCSVKGGAKMDAMSQSIEWVCHNMGIGLTYSDGLPRELIGGAQECLLVSAARGLRMALGAGQKRFYRSSLVKVCEAMQKWVELR